jgi:hypothetical protein
MDPAAPGHQSSSGGLLPAFNGNTKPLKYRDWMSFCAAEFYARLRDEKRVEAGGKDRRVNE